MSLFIFANRSHKREKVLLCKSLPQSRVHWEIPMNIYNTEGNKDIQISAWYIIYLSFSKSDIPNNEELVKTLD